MSSSETSVLKVTSFQFVWEFEGASNHVSSKVFPEDINLPKFKAAYVRREENKGPFGAVITSKVIEIQSISNNKSLAKIVIFRYCSQTKEKVKIGESLTCFSPTEVQRFEFELPKETVKLVFDVSLCFESKHNEDELGAVVPSAQDIPNNLGNDMGRLYESEQCHDVTLTVHNDTFKAHKAVLIARSPVFAEMFQQDHQLISITLSDIAPDVLAEMLRYMYTDKVMNLDEKAEALLAASEKYAMPNLKFKCLESLFAKISIQTAVRFLIIADQCKAKDLVTKTLNYIIQNVDAVMELQEWKDLGKTHAHLFVEAFALVTK